MRLNILLKINVLLLIVIIFFSCKKVDLPNEQSKLLIGRWQYYKTIEKSFSGNFVVKPEDDIVFRENGKFIDRDWKILTAHESYHIEVSASSITGEEINTIKYSKTSPNSFKISNDTLYMYILVGVRTKIYVRK